MIKELDKIHLGMLEGERDREESEGKNIETESIHQLRSCDAYNFASLKNLPVDL